MAIRFASIGYLPNVAYKETHFFDAPAKAVRNVVTYVGIPFATPDAKVII